MEIHNEKLSGLCAKIIKKHFKIYPTIDTNTLVFRAAVLKSKDMDVLNTLSAMCSDLFIEVYDGNLRITLIWN